MDEKVQNAPPGTVYATLDNLIFETRFLRLRHDGSAFDSSLHGELFTAPLFSPPLYTALSYYWGTTARSSLIEIDGYGLPITANLEGALWRLRDKGEVVLWVDALCINQDDDCEKNQQVLHMSHIYSTAKKVVCWVGDSSCSTKHSLELLRGVPPVVTYTKFEAGAIFGLMDAIRFVVHKMKSTQSEEGTLLDDETRFEDLFARPYASYLPASSTRQG